MIKDLLETLHKERSKVRNAEKREKAKEESVGIVILEKLNLPDCISFSFGRLTYWSRTYRLVVEVQEEHLDNVKNTLEGSGFKFVKVLCSAIWYEKEFTLDELLALDGTPQKE